MDGLGIEAMSKKEVLRELQNYGLSIAGTKKELKLRLQNHLKTTVALMDDDEEKDDASDSSGKSEDDCALERRLKNELEEMLRELHALRTSLEDGTERERGAHRTAPCVQRSTIARRMTCVCVALTQR